MAENQVLETAQKDVNTTFFNPFPGLRPFGIDESHLFFGREGQSDEVLDKLAENRFSAVLGASGSGKSSLMYCGLLPILYGGFIAEAGSSWHTVVSRPGSGPINNLAKALVASIGDETESSKDRNVQEKITSTILRSSSLGLIEALKQLGRPKKENILLLVDQFEELFRFKKGRTDSNSDNEAQAFVKLLTEAINQSEIPVYVVLTMRSDFIGDCAQFPELTQKINNSHYLIPQMTRDDLKDAIVGPVAVGGGAISSRLVEQLLNSVGDNPDQLPILQHALMRTWDYWSNNRQGSETMDLKHYDAIGRMEEALSQHANEAFDELSEEEKVLCERIFKTLTEKGSDNRGIRSPSSVKELVDITESTQKEVANVINRFRKSGRSFMTPGIDVAIAPEVIVDISHESLMRVWDRLKYWVDEEAQAILMYMRLGDAAELYQEGKSGLWRPPDLQLALNWREKQQPNLKWATQYDPAFERAMVFLNTSAKEYELEEQNKIRLQKKALRRTRLFAIVLGAVTIFALCGLVFAVIQKQKADQIAIQQEKAKKEAQEARAEALMQAEEAKKQREVALLATQEAEEQRANAEAQATEAEKQRQIAENQKQRAESALFKAKESAIEAQTQRRFAEQKAKEAEEQRLIAEAKAKEADEQRLNAEKSKKDAYNLRMISIAQSMSVKSLQVNRDTTRKALIAFQAYNFNQNYGGKPHNADIYSGLYYALKHLKPEEYNALQGHEEAVRSLSFTKDGTKLYTTGSDGKVLQWDMTNTSSEPTEFRSLDDVNRSMSLSKSGELLAVATESGTIQLLDINNPDKKPEQLKGHSGVVWDVEYAPDGKLYSTGADSRILQWTTGQEEPLEFAITTSRLRDIAISSNGKWLAAGSESGEILLWDLTSGEQKGTLGNSSGNRVYAVTFSNDSKTVVSGDQIGNVKIWDLESMSLKTSLEGQSAQINQIKFSSDDELIAAASFDGSVQLWDLNNLNDQPLVLKDHKFWVWTIAFSPDNSKLITGCADGLTRIWATRTDKMANEICGLIDRNMSKKEWVRYVAETSDVPYEKTCADREIGDGIKDEDLSNEEGEGQ